MVATRSSTKQAEMTDQQAATSAAALEPSQQPVTLADVAELLARDARQQAERDVEQAEEKKMAAEQDARQQAMLEKWAAEQQKMWADHKASLREEASRWRDATEVRPKRLELPTGLPVGRLAG